MESRIERKHKYYDWHAADLGTLGELEGKIESCRSVLDLGCGSGWLSEMISRTGVSSVVGIDIDEQAIAEMNEHASPGVRGIYGQTDSLPFDNDSFDLVVAKDILEHLLFPGSTTREVFRVLKPGGWLYVATPSPSSTHFYDDYTHVRPFSRRGLSALLEDTGFAVEKLYYTGNYPGVGHYMRYRGQRKLPRITYLLAKIGFRRNNVHAWARKPVGAHE